MSELRNKIELFIGTLKKDLTDIVVQIEDNRSKNLAKQNMLNKKEILLNEKETRLINKEKEMEQFKKVSFIASMSKQVTNKNNKIPKDYLFFTFVKIFHNIYEV